MKNSLENILQEKNLLRLRTNEFVVVNNSKLKSLLSILWLYRDETLNVSNVAPEMEKDMGEVQIIQDEHFLLLNPDDKGYERILLLKVNSEKNNLDIKEIVSPQLSQGKFKILYG
jgi:hypothetical protein